MARVLSYPPPWQDAPTLCEHLCISERTLDAWVKMDILPPPRPRGGKRMWRWSEVDAKLGGDDDAADEQDITRRVYNATKAAAHR